MAVYSKNIILEMGRIKTFTNWYKSRNNPYLENSMKELLQDTEINYSEGYTVKSIKNHMENTRKYQACYEGEPFGETITAVDLDFPLRNADILDRLGFIIAKHKEENEALKNLMK